MKNLILLFLVSMLVSVQLKAINVDSLASKVKVSKQFYADVKDGTSTIHQDIKSLVQYTGVKLDTIANNVVRITSKAANNLWNILVRQQKVMAWYILISWLLSIYSIYRASILINTNEDWSLYKIIGVGWVISAIMVFIFCTVNLQQVYIGFLNPEYGALKELYEFSLSK